ncbi:hypothetical protein C8R42DRAFT_721889 [Lentinula raphanica]|nr:hypothetical protein C8R42DRAFT_721889 [Lentinula raphanica]
MSSRKDKDKVSSSGKTQYRSSHKIQFSAPVTDFAFHDAVRARDGLLSTKKPILFLPSSPEEAVTLQRLWPSVRNTLDSAFEQSAFSHLDDVDFPLSMPSDYNSQLATNYYPAELVQLYKPFATGPLCRVDASFLYRGLRIIQDAVADIMATNKSRQKTQGRILELLQKPLIQNALKHYRRFWHRSRSCPLFAVRFMCMFSDYSDRYLDSYEYSKYVYDEKKNAGLGVSASLRSAVKNAFKPGGLTVASLAIPIPFDYHSNEGHLIVQVASTGTSQQAIRDPYTNQILLPEPGYEVTISRTPPPQASSSRLGIASPVFSDEGVVSAVGSPIGSPVGSSFHEADADLGETDASSDEPEAADVFKGSRVRTRAGTDLANTRNRTTRTSPAKIGPPVGKGKGKARSSSKPAVVIKVKRERPDEGTAEPTSAPAPKKQKTGKAEGKARAVDTPPAAEEDELEHEEVAPPELSVAEVTGPLADNDTDVEHLVSYLANPNYKPKLAFSVLYKRASHSTPKRRNDMQILREPKWSVSPELEAIGSFLTTGNVSFSLSNLARFAHLTSRGLAPSSHPVDPDVAPTTDCVSCLIRGLNCRSGAQLGGPCFGCEQSHRTCSSALHMELQSDLLDIIPEAVRTFPGGYSDAVEQFQEALDNHFRVMENTESLLHNSLAILARQVNKLKRAGLDANVVLSAWAEEHPNQELDYDTACWFATFFGWNSSCNLSAYLKDSETIAKFQAFIRAHDVEVPAPPSTDMLYENEIAAKEPSLPPVVREYSHMTAQSGPIEDDKSKDEKKPKDDKKAPSVAPEPPKP